MSSRLLAIWLLEVFPEVEEKEEDEEEDVVERGIMMDPLEISDGESLVNLLRVQARK
jgi:hypothetical protein